MVGLSPHRCALAGAGGRYVEELAGASRRCGERCQGGAAVPAHRGEVADRRGVVSRARFTFGGKGRQRQAPRRALDRLAPCAARLKPPLRKILRLYGLGSIGHSSRAHSSQPFSSRAAWGERPRPIADLILWQRSQSGLSLISATHSWGRRPSGFFADQRIKVPCVCAVPFIAAT